MSCVLTQQDFTDNPYWLTAIVLSTLTMAEIITKLCDYKFSYNSYATRITIIIFLPSTGIEMYNAAHGCFVPWEPYSPMLYNLTIFVINLFMFLLYCILICYSGTPIGRYVAHSLFHIVNSFIKVMIFCTMRPALYYHLGTLVTSERSRDDYGYFCTSAFMCYMCSPFWSDCQFWPNEVYEEIPPRVHPKIKSIEKISRDKPYGCHDPCWYQNNPDFICVTYDDGSVSYSRDSPNCLVM